MAVIKNVNVPYITEYKVRYLIFKETTTQLGNGYTIQYQIKIFSNVPKPRQFGKIHLLSIFFCNRILKIYQLRYFINNNIVIVFVSVCIWIDINKTWTKDEECRQFCLWIVYFKQKCNFLRGKFQLPNPNLDSYKPSRSEIK